MLEVKNEVFYHYNSNSNQNENRLLLKGDIISVGDSLNPFMTSFENHAPPIIDNKQALVNAVTFYWHYTRETVFEEVRLKTNDKLPSRQKALWVCDEGNKDYWKTHYLESQGNLLKLILNGNIFKCDSTYVEGNPRRLTDLREDAKNYWLGNIKDDSKTEYLFTGEAIVIDVL